MNEKLKYLVEDFEESLNYDPDMECVPRYLVDEFISDIKDLANEST